MPNCGFVLPVARKVPATRLLNEMADGGFCRTNEGGGLTRSWVPAGRVGVANWLLSALASIVLRTNLQAPRQWPQTPPSDSCVQHHSPAGYRQKSALRLARRRYLRSQPGRQTGSRCCWNRVLYCRRTGGAGTGFPEMRKCHPRSSRLARSAAELALAGYGDIERCKPPGRMSR